MSLDDWILALHLLAAFALVGALVIFWIMIVALWNTDSTTRVASLMTVSKVGTIMVAAGSVGTIVFGIWLAISLDAYQVWDGWVIAAIVLWAIAVATGKRSGDILGADPGAASEETQRRALLLHGIASVLVVLVLVDMIWKPGA